MILNQRLRQKYETKKKKPGKENDDWTRKGGTENRSKKVKN